jgi:uncharacterized membrane protein YphA (DoxX/SURF4 family)
MTKLSNSTDCSQRRIIAYWFTTAIVAAEFAVGGVMDILRIPPFSAILEHLGYPGYFSVILGVWKVLGAVALLVPRSPRLKEWAYAGMIFNMTGAVASHLSVGDPPVTLVAPIIFTSLVAASWALRPSARCDDLGGFATSSRARRIAYWVITVLVATECLVGGMMGALRRPRFIGIMEHLGYPAYFMTIIGVWYVLGAVALLVPQFPRLKEWAYAGMVFIYTGAVASRLAVGDPAVTLVARSSSPPSWSPPGPCARRLAAFRHAGARSNACEIKSTKIRI